MFFSFLRNFHFCSFFILSPFIFHAFPSFPSSLKGTIFPVSSLEACLYHLSVVNHSSSPLSVAVSSLKGCWFISPPRSFRFQKGCIALFSHVFLSLYFPVINKSLSFYPRTLVSNSSIKPGFFQCTYIPLLSVHSSMQLSSLDFPLFNSSPIFLFFLLVLNILFFCLPPLVFIKDAQIMSNTFLLECFLKPRSMFSVETHVEHQQHVTKSQACFQSSILQLTQRYANECLATLLNYHHDNSVKP